MPQVTSETFKFIASLILVVLTGSGLVACAASSDNPHDNWVLMSQGIEKDLGQSYANQLEKQVGLYESDTFNRYIDNVGSRVAVYSQRPDLDYKFGILDVFQINALALPGGYVYATRGLLRAMDSEAELAGVLAHEVAHVAAYHAVKRQQWSAITMMSAAAMAVQTGGRGLGPGLMAQQMFVRGYTRNSEDQADRLGLRYMAQSGYDPEGLVDFLQTLQRVHEEIPQRDLLFMRTHPFLADRIRRANNDMDQYKSLLNDTPLVGRYRYSRYKRQFLFKPDEEQFLSVFNQYVDAYKNKNPSGMRELMSSDFRFGSKDSAETTAEFMDTMESRMRRSEKIEYNTQLMKLDVGDTDAVLLYEFSSRRWIPGKEKPVLEDGIQEMVWRRKNDQWRLSRLR